MNTLFAKLSTALLLIVGLMGTAFFVVERINTRLYYEELTQRLNAPIAMYVTGQRQLIDNGVPDLDGLGELASHAMVINPTAEIYLLDTDGNILGHVLPEDTSRGRPAQRLKPQGVFCGRSPIRRQAARLPLRRARRADL
jgi:hypothetical protein